MVSLVDIGPLKEAVTFRGQSVEAQGLSALAIFELLKDIPELRKIMAQKAVSEDEAAALILSIPHAVGKIIAAGTGKLGDAPTIAVAMAMTAGEQLAFVEAIVRMTFPQGIKSFLASLEALAPKDALGWAQATRSHAPSNGASQQDTPQPTAGTTHPDSSQDGSN